MGRSKVKKRRARRNLRRHESVGDNRHVKSAQVREKQKRAQAEHAAAQEAARKRRKEALAVANAVLADQDVAV